MCSRWWRQGRNEIDQLQWREVQLVHLGATLVSARLTVLLGAAVHQGGALFAQSLHGKGWAGAVAQQPLQGGAVVCLDADTGIDREAAVLLGQHVFGINTLDQLDETTKSAWSEVLNQYQRRADLVPNIVATVKGEAAFEQDTQTKVIDARAKATWIQVTPETLNSPEAFKKFEAAQGELGNALGRLMVVSEQYPSLKANQGFRDLRVQLEGTENRVTVARNRYIQAVQDYNVLARSFPSNLTAMVFSYAAKPNFTVQNEATVSAPPVVDFTKKNNHGDRSGSGWLGCAY